MSPISPSAVPRAGVPDWGAGVGLRRRYHQQIIDEHPPVRWFEILTENYLNRGGIVRRELLEIAEHYPVCTHGIAMSIGGAEPLDWDHLRAVKQLNKDVNAKWSGEHLCFSYVDHKNLSGLIPLPFTEEAIETVAGRVREIQDFLELPFVIENVTYYMTVSDRQMGEIDFINGILDRADCGILVDVNNVYINSINNHYDPVKFIESIPAHRIAQIHLAGHDDSTELIKDTHDRPVNDAVWDLFRTTLRHAGPVSTNIEWDADFPPWSELLEETQRTQAVIDEVFA